MRLLRKYSPLVMLLLFLIALCARLIPLQFSNLPFNIDGFPLAKISEIMIATGGIPDPANYSGLLAYNMKLPVFSLLLAEFSMVLGVEPLYLMPYFTALIGSMAVLFIYMITRELTRNDMAALGAGIFAALSGLFVYVTTASMKQLVAIVLLCFVFYAFSKRNDWRYRIAMMLGLGLLPFTHHLTSLMAMLMLCFALAGTAFRRGEVHVRTTKGLLLDAITGPGILLVTLFYYQAVNMEFYSEVSNANDLVLLASVAIIMAVFARLVSMTVQTKPWFFLDQKEEGKLGLGSIIDEKVLILVIGIGVFLANSRLHLFTGAQLTSDALINMITPYLILAIVGLVGFNVLRYSSFPRRYIIVGMFMAPLTVMVFAMLRSLDVFGFMVVYRSYNFIDIPLAVAVGVGIAWLFKTAYDWGLKSPEFRFLPFTLFTIFVVLAAASLPLAYNNQETFDVQEITYQYELDSLEWAKAHNITEIASDQRCSDIGAPYLRLKADRTGAWRMDRNMLEKGEAMLISMNWADDGAQFYPLGRIQFTHDELDNALASWDIVYAGGPRGNEMVIGFVQ